MIQAGKLRKGLASRLCGRKGCHRDGIKLRASAFRKGEWNFTAHAKHVLAALLLLFSWQICIAQPKSGLRQPVPVDPVKAEKEGTEFVADLLAQKPDKAVTNSGMLTIRNANNKKTQIAVRFEVIPTETNWISLFQSVPAGDESPEVLVVIHSDNQPNQYQLRKQKQETALMPNQTMVPFAGSDFWLADLGLEFLHWPKPRLLRKEMRHYQFCGVLECTNPDPANGYQRVVAWIDMDTGAIVHADAYDSRKKILKEFDPTDLKKVNGKHELEGMEMRNRQTHSHTTIRFKFD
jgi:hypothetical protein